MSFDTNIHKNGQFCSLKNNWSYTVFLVLLEDKNLTKTVFVSLLKGEMPKNGKQKNDL